MSWKVFSTNQLFRQCIEDGLTGATDIADEMGISKGQVSKLADKGDQERLAKAMHGGVTMRSTARA